MKILRVFTLYFFVTTLAFASDGGKSLYLLGMRGPLAGLIPKPGLYFQNDLLFYNASSSSLFPITNRVNQNLNADVVLDLPQLIWVTNMGFADGRLAFSAVVPYGRSKVSAQASATTLNGLTLNLVKVDKTTAFADPAISALMGWRKLDKNYAAAWNVYLTTFIPAGSYQPGVISSLGMNRYAMDVGSGFSFASPQKKHELSGVIGVTFNGKNRNTGYKTGTEGHLEYALKQHLGNKFSLGVVGFYFQQITGDSNGPIFLGPFKGRVVAIGPEISKLVKLGNTAINFDLRWYHEFAVQNRVKGDAIYITAFLPIKQ